MIQERRQRTVLYKDKDVFLWNYLPEYMRTLNIHLNKLNLIKIITFKIRSLKKLWTYPTIFEKNNIIHSCDPGLATILLLWFKSVKLLFAKVHNSKLESSAPRQTLAGHLSSLLLLCQTSHVMRVYFVFQSFLYYV